MIRSKYSEKCIWEKKKRRKEGRDGWMEGGEKTETEGGKRGKAERQGGTVRRKEGRKEGRNERRNE